MTWIPADGKYDKTGYGSYTQYTETGMATDPYPNKGNTTFNKSSNPAAKFYNKNTDDTYYMWQSVENITQNSDGTISFSFVGLEGTPAPTFTPEAGIYDEAVSVTLTAENEEAEIFYTLDGTTPNEESTKYVEPINITQTTTINAIAIAGDKQSSVVRSRYIIRQPATDAKVFKRVTSVSELESGKSYVLACPEKNVAAGEMSNRALTPYDITRYDDLIIKTDDVKLLTLDIDNGAYSLYNEEGQFLTATGAKALNYSDKISTLQLTENEKGVMIGFASYGTLFYSTVAKMFNNYINNATSTLITSVLYAEYDLTDKLDATMSYDQDKYETTTDEEFTAPTLSLNPENLAVKFSSSDESVATVDETNGKITVNAIGTTTIMAAFEGDEIYNPASASYLLEVKEGTPDAIMGVTDNQNQEPTKAYSLDGRQIDATKLQRGIYIVGSKKIVK